MAKFLTTTGNSHHIEQIIINAKNSLTLVTPYLKLSKNLIERISDADRKGIIITLIYGKKELTNKEKEVLYSLSNIEIYFFDNLHAKCYHNEDSMIITSMNLHEYSEKNNREMGLLIEKEIDVEIFNDALKEIESIINSSKLKKTNRKGVFDKLIRMYPEYDELWNFYLPSLHLVLEKKYSNHIVTFDNNEITIKDFPFNGIDMKANGKIDFKIYNNELYNRIEKKFREKFSFLPDRFYWNNEINIYEEKKFTVDLTDEGLIKKVKKKLDIIETFYNHVKPEEKKLKFGIMMC